MAAAGSAAITEEVFGSVKEIIFSWTSGTGGTVLADCTTTSFYSGELLFVVTVPGTAGEAPTDNYDVTLLEKSDVDLLADNGLNRATATTESIVKTSLGTVANSQLELNVQNAGSSNTGVVYVWIR
jgi:hypothetical protein